MKYKVNVHPHTRKGSDKIYLFLRVSVDGSRTELPTGISCPASAFLKDSRTIVGAPIDNLKLQELIAKAERILLQMSLSGGGSLSDFLAQYNNNESLSKEATSFTQAVDRFINEQALLKSWSESTIKKFHVISNRVEGWRPGTRLNDIDKNWLTSFMGYLSKGYDKTKKDGSVSHYNYRNTSLQKMLKNFRWFLRWAKDKGLYTGNSENFTMELKGGAEPLSDILYLTAEELHQLMDHQWTFEQRHLERVVDVFIFACYSGLRFSDIDALRRHHIHDGAIHIASKKTTVKIAIPLNKTTTAILDKYKDYHDRLDRPFPVITDQRMNEELKQAARLCGLEATVNRIWYTGSRKHEETIKKCDALSFHCARRTFITQALVLGIPDAVLIQLTGHTSTKMLKRYQGIVDTLKQEQINKFDTL